MGIETEIARVHSFETLGREWEELEARSDASFFQSWTWVGCLAEERFPNPVLLRASEHGETVGLALLNRRRGCLHLGESGDGVLDSPFVEHNGPLVVRGRPDVAAALLRAAWRVRWTWRLVLSGVPEDTLRAAGGVALRAQERPAPFLDLAAIRAGGGDWLATRSANTRAQIRRSLRFHEATHGPLVRTSAASEGEARAFLDDLMALHGASWRRRNLPGAFATDFARRFHVELVARAIRKHQLDLQRFTAGTHAIGYLYNFQHGRSSLAYQSGFVVSDRISQARPGLTCHALAIMQALSADLDVYDFLAGPARYKLSLSNGASRLFWFDCVSETSLAGRVARLLRPETNSQEQDIPKEE